MIYIYLILKSHRLVKINHKNNLVAGFLLFSLIILNSLYPSLFVYLFYRIPFQLHFSKTNQLSIIGFNNILLLRKGVKMKLKASPKDFLQSNKNEVANNKCIYLLSFNDHHSDLLVKETKNCLKNIANNEKR